MRSWRATAAASCRSPSSCRAASSTGSATHLADQLHIAPQLTTYYYGFNLRRAPFKDSPQLRRALSLVIDREKLAQLVLRVGRAARLRLGAAGGRQLHLAVLRLPRQADARAHRARRSGCTARPATRRAQPLRFELRYNSGEVHTKLALAIASMWKEALGVRRAA